MKLPSKTTWISALAAFALLAWYYGGSVADYASAKANEVAALTALPRVYFAAGVVLFALGAAAMFVQGVLQGRDGSFRGYRLLPILAVLALFADLFFLPPQGEPVPSYLLARRDADAFAAAAQAMANEASVPTAPEALERAAGQLGRPPYLVRAERPGRYSIRVRNGCQGPATDPQREGAGTLLYCVAADAKRAWVTVVGLPVEQRFGAPAVLSVSGAPYVAEIVARAPARSAAEEPPRDEPEDEPLPAQPLTPDARGDGGR